MRNSLDLTLASRFFTPSSRSESCSSNFIFRFGFCGLGEKFAADVVGVSLEQVYEWDDGLDIPVSVRKVWLYESGRALPPGLSFDGFSFARGRIITPDGVSYTSNQVMQGLYLLDQSVAHFGC